MQALETLRKQAEQQGISPRSFREELCPAAAYATGEKTIPQSLFIFHPSFRGSL